MTLLTPLANPVAFGPDAEGTPITAEAVSIKWVTLDFTSGEANFECTLPNRPDVAFARTVPFDDTDVSTASLTATLALEIESTIPPVPPEPETPSTPSEPESPSGE